MGNRKITLVTRIGKYELMLKSGVRIDLNNCCYSSEMTRNIISFHALFKDGYKFSFDNENGDILVYSNGCFMFKASPCKGIYETVECISHNGNVILNVGSSNELDKSKLWHSRLGHVNKKRIAQLQKDGVLESFDFKSNDVCESCLLGKMTKSPFTESCERGEGLLDLVHTDMCGPFQTATKDRKRYYVTFTDDFSRYGYVYLIKHKSDTFKVFKRYQNEVENQLGTKIKVLQSDNRGEYLSIEFFDHLKNYGIVSQLTPPRIPQLNGVAERRNRTLKGVFLEREMISTEDSRSKIDLEKIQESVNEEPILNIDTQQEVVTPDKISDSTLSELDEPANYKEAMASPEAAKWKEAMKSEIQSMFLVYGGEKELRVIGYYYASWQTDKDGSRSQSGWLMRLQKEAIWMKNFIRDLGVIPIVQDPIEIFYDNESVVALTKEPKDHGKSKHIERKYHFV
ncbi:retrotransposon protein, putative, ty1-copia subclass [Tanacetum coccineum]